MSGWEALAAELDAWAAASRTATLWWRDDDAARPEPALDRLLELAARCRVPLCLAVVPAAAGEALAAATARAADMVVAVHGYAHRNHAVAGARKAELGPERPLDIMLDELVRGRERLEALYGEDVEPILVPPWNRISPPLVPRLPAAGFKGLSTYGARRERAPTPGLVQVNTHLDIMARRNGRGFIGSGPALSLAVAHLAARRLGRVDADEATGLLTHHLVHDAGAWDFVARFLDATRRHAAARWLSAAAAFSFAA